MEVFGMSHFLSLSLAVFAEVICSLFILLGFATRLAVIPLIITMLVVVFYIHADDPFGKQEMGLHYLLTYIMLLIMGSGKYSIDNLLYKKSNYITTSNKRRYIF
jgi:putative oxidoreductase